MSLAATRIRKNENLKYEMPLSLSEELADRGIEWNGHSLVRLDSDQESWEISQDDLDEIDRLRSIYTWHHDDLDTRIEEVLRGKSQGAAWIALHYREDRISLQEAIEKLRTIRRINRAMRDSPLEWSNASATKLFELGIRHPQEALRFMAGFHKFSNLSRPWGSCYQVDFRVLDAAVNGSVNYQKLPDWCVKTLVRVGYNFASARPGNIWRLIPCAKAWKWCSALPKRIAERIGKMSVKARMLAPIAWEISGEYASEAAYEVFWLRLQALLKLDLVEVLELLFLAPGQYALISRDRLSWGRRNLTALMSEYLGLDFNYPGQAHGKIALHSECNLENCLDQIAEHCDAETVMNLVFRCSGKKTIEAYRSSTSAARKYARYLAVGNANLLQKYFALTECLPYYPEAVEFLESLHSRVALRMLETRTYKTRGTEHKVEDYLVQDTGLMFSNIKGDPNLSRVRCWLSAHEELSRRFIGEQPDEALEIHPAFASVDGLCAIDQSWELVMPKSTVDLKRWGNVLKHCVGAYGDRVKHRKSVIVGVFVNGEVLYTIEMLFKSGSWYVRQFLGHQNSSPDSEFSALVGGEILAAIR